MIKMENEDKLVFKNRTEVFNKFVSSGSKPEVSYDDQGVHADPKWTNYLLEKEEEEKPRLPITERINLMLEKEKQEREAAYSRGTAVLSAADLREPFALVKVQKPTEEEIQAKIKAWREKLDKATKEYQAKWKIHKREMDLEKQKQEKILKDSLPRDYYWQPHPLFSLHLKELGYSNIAIDRALFSVNNESAKAAVEYLKANPNPKELTKEDVIAVGKEALRKVRLGLPNNDFSSGREEYSQQTESFDSEQTGSFDSEQTGSFDCEQTGNWGILTVTDKRGMKRKCNRKKDRPGKKTVSEKEIVSEKKTIPEEEKVPKEEKVCKEETVPEKTTEPQEKKKKTVIVEKSDKYKLFLLSNVSLAMDAIALSLESSKVAVKIMDKLFQGDDELHKIRFEWEKNGNTMEMYRIRGSNRLRALQKEAERHGYINYMAESSQYVSKDLPSPTVLGFIGKNKHLRLLTNNLKLL